MSQNIGTQTEAKVNVDIGTQTKDSANNIFVIQRKDKGKKRSTYKKRDIKDIPNAYPTIEQQYRIFKEIDYPYLMRDVGIQGDDELYDDKLINTLREGLGIKKMTPELVAERALEEGRKYQNVASHTIYSPTEQNLTDTQRLVRAINKNPDLRRRVITSLNSIQNKESIQPLTFEEMAKNYMSELSAYKEARWGSDIEAGAPYSAEDYPFPSLIKQQEKEFEEMVRAKAQAFGAKKPLPENPEEYKFKMPKFQGRGRKAIIPKEISLQGAKTSTPASFITNEADLENLIGVMENTGIYEGKIKNLKQLFSPEQIDQLRLKGYSPDEIIKRASANITLRAFMKRTLAKDEIKNRIAQGMKAHELALQLERREQERRIQDLKSLYRFDPARISEELRKYDFETLLKKRKEMVENIIKSEKEKAPASQKTPLLKAGKPAPPQRPQTLLLGEEELKTRKRGRPPKDPLKERLL